MPSGIYPRPSISERFWAEVIIKQVFDCWLWRGGVDSDGYGKFWDGSKRTGAHRFAYQFYIGMLSNKDDVHHICGEPRCVNPSHLTPMLHGQHTLLNGGVSGKAKSVTHCPRGHEYNSANTYRDKRGFRNCKICLALRGRSAPRQY